MTIDTKHLAVYPSTIVRRQEAYDAGDVDGKANTSQRRPGRSVLGYISAIVSLSNGIEN